jgi:hypothetical protein
MAAKGSFDPALRDASGNFIPWKRRNKEASNAATRRRLLAKKQADPLAFKAEAKKWHLKHKYGITPELKELFIISQNFECAICKVRMEDVNGNQWATDHSHSGGYVRGMLCKPCNSAIGLLKDDPKILRAAAEYLEVTATIPDGGTVEDFESAIEIVRRANEKSVVA